MSELWDSFQIQILPVWQRGGWLMPGLALLALVIYYVAIELWRDANRWPLERLMALGENQIAEAKLPQELQVALSGTSVQETIRAMDSLRREVLSRLDRRTAFLAILTSAAPLIGLLGTVSGLLDTFRGLSQELGPLAEGAANGLYAALISTQTGLIIAIPAYIFLYSLRRRRDEWAAAITHVESIALRTRRKEAA